MSEESAPSVYPDGITQRHVDPVPAWRRHASPLGLVVFSLVVGAALLGLLGREGTWASEGRGARLEVHTSEVIRNGEFFEMRVRVTADEDVAELVIGIEDSLWQDVTVNTLIPAASDEENVDGETRFTFASLPAGTTFQLKVDMQINPDILGGTTGRVTVYDGDTELVATPISITVLP